MSGINIKQAVLNTIKDAIVKDMGRVDVVLLPHDNEGKNGQFFVVYTVEYAEMPYVSSVKLFEGTYVVENDTLKLTVNGHTINVKLDYSIKIVYRWIP